jgi:transposase
MPGPKPIYNPTFPTDFLDYVEQCAHKRTIKFQLRQRAELVLLLHEQPFISNPAAAAKLQMHPNSVRLWRQRWANEDFTLEDESGRGRKPRFSPQR